MNTRIAALAWGIVVLLACGFVLWRAEAGLHFRTDLTALLPREAQQPELQAISDAALQQLSQRLVLVLGDRDPAKAHAAAHALRESLRTSERVIPLADQLSTEQIKTLGALYYPYRYALLSDADRERLQQHQPAAIAQRALAQVYGVTGLANGALLQRDPFLLLPQFLTHLPLPSANFALEDGLLTRTTEGKTWVLLPFQMRGDPYALADQQALMNATAQAITAALAQAPSATVLRLGAPYFASAGATQAIEETRRLSLLSLAATLLLVGWVFRSLAPLLLSLLVIATGMLVALAVSLAWFHELHVAALLFGTTLMGVTVDYSLQYCTERLGHRTRSPQACLQRVLPGITLGTATTIIGYLTLALAPFPGLQQVAWFSVVGLAASWLTVVLWLPRLESVARKLTATDRRSLLPPVGQSLALRVVRGWHPLTRRGRAALLALLALMPLGLMHLTPDDAMQHMQALNPSLRAQKEQIQHLLGMQEEMQFFLVRGANDEQRLQREEWLAERLNQAVHEGALDSFQSLAQFVPSQQRQHENAALIVQQLAPHLAAQQRALHLTRAEEIAAPQHALLPQEVLAHPALASLKLLQVTPPSGPAAHLVLLSNVHTPEALRNIAAEGEGISYINPTADYSALLKKYRLQAVALAALSLVLMLPVLLWRYRRRSLWVLLPSVAALTATPALLALLGLSFTFFDAMGLVLILSVGVDYSVFYAETRTEHLPTTALAVALAACAAALSFGLLLLSAVSALTHLGATMLLGITLSYLFAPLARRAATDYSLS